MAYKHLGKLVSFAFVVLAATFAVREGWLVVNRTIRVMVYTQRIARLVFSFNHLSPFLPEQS
jgi:hypothetical protein